MLAPLRTPLPPAILQDDAVRSPSPGRRQTRRSQRWCPGSQPTAGLVTGSTNGQNAAPRPRPFRPDPVSSDPSSQPTRLLQQINAGDRSAVERLLPIIYGELHALAQRIMGGERREHTLQPTALINEAFLRLVDQESPEYQDRVHFVRVASRAMRNVLVDHARARAAQKRGGGRLEVTLDAGLVVDASAPEQLLVVDETLERLGAVDPQLAQIVELRYFGGLTDKEIGAAIGVSERTVQRSWRIARAWMTREMAKEGGTQTDVD